MKQLLTILFCILFFNCFGQNKPKCDTVQVVLLICNKFYYSNHTPTIPGYFDKAGAVMWVTAYSVRKEDIEYGNYFNGQGGKNYTTWEHLYYLDSGYNPLSKSIIVWMAKELQP